MWKNFLSKIFILVLLSAVVREVLEEVRGRRSVVKGLIAGGVAVIVGATDRHLDSAIAERTEKARTHLNNACDHLNRNYDRFSAYDLATPSGVYELETAPIRQNLDQAKQERDRALELDGFIGLNRDVRTAIDDLSIFIDIQETMYYMFAISGSVDEDILYDEQIGRTLTAVMEQEDSNQLSPNPAARPPDAPFDSGRYRDVLSDVRNPDGELTAQLSHSVPELLDIAENGLAILSGLDLLHRQLVAHLELPNLDRAILEIDQWHSQANYIDTSAYQTGLQELRAYSLGFDFDRSIPEEIRGLTLADRSITASEVEQSAVAYQHAASVFEQSVSAWEEGRTETSNKLWSDGLTAMHKATHQSPFRR